MKVSPILAVIVALISLSLPACGSTHAHEKESAHEEQQKEEQQKIILTSPLEKDVTITQKYVCQIRSQRNIEIRPLQDGYLEAISVKEGQAVKQGDVIFKIVPILYEARLNAERAEARLALIEFQNTDKLFRSATPVVSNQEVALAQAKLDKANAKADLAAAELAFTIVKAPFDGIIDRLQQQQGSLVEKKDVLTTLSDNSVMWVYFNVPEARYLEYMANMRQHHEDQRLELVLADGSTFKHAPNKVVTVEGKFNNETGNIPFRADFPNPDRLLRHGQTGNMLIHRTLKNAVVIPQRATYEILDKRYVYVVGKDNKAHSRPIVVDHEMDDIFVIKNGLDANDKIVLEGVRQIHDGSLLENTEFRKPEEALTNQKFHAE